MAGGKYWSRLVIEVLPMTANDCVPKGNSWLVASTQPPGTFQVDVTDGELNLQFSDNGGSNRDWTATRVLLNRVGSPLQAASGPVADRSAESITTDDVAALAGTAIQYWELTGYNANRFSNVEFVVADLGGNLLGLQSGNTIYIDDDAAGYGWYLDDDATTDEAFTGIDLFTTLAHELGHVLGHKDLYADQHADDLLYGYLEEGERRASLEELDSVFAEV